MSRVESMEPTTAPASDPMAKGKTTVPALHKEEWHCPYCDHSLTYRPEITEVAELAIRSHMLRRHPDICDE
jgi:hypothetical protein